MSERKLLCAATIYRPSKGIAGLPKTKVIAEVCGRPAVLLFRGIRDKPDGTVYLNPWEPRCHRCRMPGWEADMRRLYSGIGNREIEKKLGGYHAKD